MGGMIKFPSWLGKNSTTNKNDRILAELRNHMRLKLVAFILIEVAVFFILILRNSFNKQCHIFIFYCQGSQHFIKKKYDKA